MNYLPQSHTLVYSLLLLLSFTGASFAQSQPKEYKVIETAAPKRLLHHSGGYVPIGKKPVSFSNFYNFTFEPAGRIEKGKMAKYVGAVNLYKSDSGSNLLYQFEELNFSDSGLSFKTETLGGILYEFVGTYLKKGDLIKYNRKNIAVMQGTLTKFSNGVKTAEAKMRFKYIIWVANYYNPK